MGPTRANGRHEVVTVMQRLDLADRIALASAARLRVSGFPDDTIVRAALERLAEVAGVDPCWSVQITKQIPVAAGLGGGSSDAASALRLANATLDEPLDARGLRELAASIGADVPFFLEHGSALATGDGSTLQPLELPQDYWALLILPHGTSKPSTAAIYAAFDARNGEEGFAERRARLESALARVREARDLAALPPNDLASSPLAEDLRGLGALRADVTGAGPAVYGLFTDAALAEKAARALAAAGRTWVAVPAWYV